MLNYRSYSFWREDTGSALQTRRVHTARPPASLQCVCVTKSLRDMDLPYRHVTAFK